MVTNNAEIIRGLSATDRERLAAQTRICLAELGKTLAPHVEAVRKAAAQIRIPQLGLSTISDHPQENQ